MARIVYVYNHLSHKNLVGRYIYTLAFSTKLNVYYREIHDREKIEYLRHY